MIRTGKLYLVGLFLIGALSAAAGVNWLQQGEIVFRSEQAPGVERVARLDRGDPLFVPIALGWMNLGSGAAALTVLSLFLKERAVERWAGYACIGLIFLAVATALVSYGAAEDVTSGAGSANGQDQQAADE